MFHNKLVDKYKEINTCWEYSGHIAKSGYGKIKIETKTKYAHRYSYEIFKGKIPDGYVIDHLCNNRICVNPEHLEAVTQKENVARSVIHRGKILKEITHCPQGHEYSPENTYKYKNSRACKICRNMHARDNKRRKRAETRKAIMSEVSLAAGTLEALNP